MLRKTAIVYLIIQSAYFSYKIYGATSTELWYEPMFWISWPINVLGLLAIGGYAFKQQLLAPFFWLIILAGYIGLRVSELMRNGLFISEWSMLQNLSIGIQYLWFVVPSVLAMLFLANSTKRMK